MNMEFKKRKPTRLQGYDYSRTGVYFITVCTKERRNYFWNNVGATIGRPQDIELSPYGVIVDEAINKIPEIYPSVSIKQYVIMPDHIHMLVLIRSDDNRRPMVAPTEEKLIIGCSAGALVLTPSLELIDLYSPEMNFMGLDDLTACNVTDVYVLPHYSKFINKFDGFEEKCSEYERSVGCEVVRINDGEGVIVNKGVVDLIK